MDKNTHDGLKKASVSSMICAVILFIVLIAIDQYTKILAVDALKGKSSISLIRGVLEFAYVENKGAAFGMLQNAFLFFAAIAVAVIAAIFYMLTVIPEEKRYAPFRLILIFIAAGAAGNLIDRFMLHYVRDFIYFSLIDFPVFNVADMYVTVSTFFLVILILFVYKDDDFSFLNRSKKEKED